MRHGLSLCSVSSFLNPPVDNNLLRYLITLGHHDQAISKCKIILNELGEPLPKQLNEEVLLLEFITLRQILGQYSVQNILALQQMTDTRKLAAMEFLQSIMSSANGSSDLIIGGVIIIRLVKITLEYGLCDMSSLAFVSFGMMLVHGKIKGGSCDGQFQSGFRRTLLNTRLLSPTY